jgi:DNA polymerase-4
MLRHILHFRIDAFPAAVERVRNPSLRGRPVAVCPRHSPRSPVFSASAEARKEGVFEGMPLVQAMRRCRSLVVVPPDEALYQRASAAVVRVLGRYSPSVEPGRWGRFYADMSGTQRLFGGSRDAALLVLRDIEGSVRFDGTVGLASNKLVSGVAARVAPPCGRFCEVPTGGEALFLAPLSVRFLPAVRRQREGALLFEFNIRFVEQLAGIPLAQLVRVFGPLGATLHHQALGIDESPVRSPGSKPFVLEEQTLAEDSNDDAVLLSVLYRLTERACRELRARGVVARTAWLHVSYSDGMDATRRLRFGRPSGVDLAVFRMLEPLFFQTGLRRQRVRLMGLTLTDLFVPPPQLDLFDSPQGPLKEERLVHALDALRGRYGEASVRFARAGNEKKPPRMLTE